MSCVFENSFLGYVFGNPFSHKVIKELLPAEDFITAVEEISQGGYTLIPLFNLQDLGASLCLENLLYKDECPRFGLGSFKALGGSYTALRF